MSGGGPLVMAALLSERYERLELNHNGGYMSHVTLPHNQNDTVQMLRYLLIEWRNFIIIHTKMTFATETRP